MNIYINENLFAEIDDAEDMVLCGVEYDGGEDIWMDDGKDYYDGDYIDGSIGVDGGEAVEKEEPSIFTSVIFLVVLTLVAVAIGFGMGIFKAKKKISKGFDDDENY